MTIHNGIESVIPSEMKAPILSKSETIGYKTQSFRAPENYRNKEQRDSSLPLRMTSGPRKEFGIPEDAVIVGTISNLYRTKGIEYFVQAVQRIKDIFPHVYFMIVGDGMLRKEIEGDISKFQLQNRIILTGFRRDVVSLLMDMDIFVLSSVKEGLPFSLLEAGSMGKPVIATRVGGIPEIIEHGRCGLLVSPADSVALAEAIKSFLTNKEMAHACGERLREKVNKNFQFSRVLEETVRVYEG